VKVLDDIPAQIPEIILHTEAPAVVQSAEPIVQRGNTGDLDNVLDLDDVLGWPTAPQTEAPQVSDTAAPSIAAAESVIPQTVIDEIVNRVVAQLSEKLTAKLASQLAPEVAELVKQQTQPEAAVVSQSAKPDSDSLLDLD